MSESTRRLVPFTEDKLIQVLEILGEDAVLVGGQALAVWVAFYNIPLSQTRYPYSPQATFNVGGLAQHTRSQEEIVPISSDSDFLGDRELVDRIAKRIVSSHPRWQLKSALSALHGVVELHLDGDTYMSIDIIHAVAGLNGSRVRDRSLAPQTPSGITFRLMHPLDVLASRVYNIAHFKEKQNENGVMQLNLALQVAKCYIKGTRDDPNLGEKTALKQIEEIIRLAKTSEGRIARGFGADYRVAIPVDEIKNENFHAIRWPQIQIELDNAVPPKYHSK